MNIEPISGLDSALRGLRNAQDRSIHAAKRIGSEGVNAMPEAQFELMQSKIETQANVKVIQTLDRTMGSLLDMVS